MNEKVKSIAQQIVSSISMVVLLCMILVPCLTDPARASAPLDLATTLRPLADKYKLPGVVAAIVHGDQVVALGSTGIRKIGDPSPFLPTDMIHLGSNTKAMTAMLIGQLIDKKQLTFDTTMREIFPDLAATMNPEMANNTVRNLLNHNAGLPHDLDWLALANAPHPPGTALSLIDQRRVAVKQALSVPPATPIGSYFYSNLSYVLLGAIIEAKTGKPWEQVIQQELFMPLHMDTAGFGAPGTPGQVDQPWGHGVKHGVGALDAYQTDNPPVMGPAGAVHCSIGDYAKFIAESLRAMQGHPTLVTAETYKQLITPFPHQELEYAGGWVISDRPWSGGPVQWHNGSNGRWYCSAWIAPGKDFALIIATNHGGQEMAQAMDEGVRLLVDFNSKLPAQP